jgi:hypothetical protein
LDIWRGGWLEIGAETAGRKDGIYSDNVSRMSSAGFFH